MSVHALRVGSVERHPGEELGRHAAALAGVVAAAAGARAGGGGSAQLAEQFAVAPHSGEPAGITHRTGAELVVDGERAGVHVADRVDEADDPAGAAHVQPGQRRAEGVEVEEAVTGEDLVAVGEQPAIDRALLVLGRVEFVPRVGAAARRAQPGDAQLGAVAVGERLEVVELGDVVPGDDDGDLERPEPGGGEVVHRRPRPGDTSRRRGRRRSSPRRRRRGSSARRGTTSTPAARAARRSTNVPLVENLTPIRSSWRSSTSSKKSRRSIGSPPPMLM